MTDDEGSFSIPAIPPAASEAQARRSIACDLTELSLRQPNLKPELKAALQAAAAMPTVPMMMITLRTRLSAMMSLNPEMIELAPVIRAAELEAGEVLPWRRMLEKLARGLG